jgi:penicillin-binding protein 2
MTEAVVSNEIENQRRRLIVVFVGLCCTAAILVARLAYWQILRHDEMTRLADREHREVVTIAPRRGNILDRRGYLLATNINSFLIYAAPKEMGEPRFKSVADQVAPLLGLNSRRFRTISWPTRLAIMSS